MDPQQPDTPPAEPPATEPEAGVPVPDPTKRWCFHRGGPKMDCDDQGCTWSIYYYRTRYKQAKLALKAAENLVTRVRPDPHGEADVRTFESLVAKLYEPIPRPEVRNPFEKEV